VKAIRAVVSGYVQGVGFRLSAARVAQRLGLSGWVCNRWDGSVEVMAQGAAAAVDEMATWLASGPPGAVVRSVKVDPADADPGLSSFEIRG
jgi:acylphosphatase